MAKKFVNNVNEKNLVLTRAQGAVISRDFPTAARLYKQLLKDDPSNVDYLKELGSIYVKNGEDAKAIPYYEQIITFYPHYIDAMTSLGAIYRRLKKYEESIEILERAVDEGRQSADVNYNLGFTYREMGNWDDAIEAFSSVVNENPSDVLAYNHLGAIYLEKKDYQKSIASFKRGLQIDQNHPILNYNLARCYSKAKMYSDAIRCFENALKAKPGWVDAIKDFSSLLVKCQKSKEASDLVKHSIELYPNDVKLLSMLGSIYLDQFDYDSAEKTFKRAKKVDDQNIQILAGLAEALEKGDKPDEALENVLDALEIAPDDKDLKKRYVQTLLSANQIEAAGTNVKELYEDDKEDPQVLDLYGQYLICNNDEAQAEKVYDKITELNRNYKDHLLSAANRLNQVGDNDNAEKKAKEFVARDMRNPAGYNMLGKIYTATGDLQGAIDSYNKSRNLRRPNILADKQIDYLTTLSEKPIVPEEPVAEDEVLEQEPVEEQAEEATEATEESPADENFDFGSMGENVPMQEALQEEEEDFFEDDESKENLEEELGTDEEVSPFDVEDEPLSDKEKLVGIKEPEEDEIGPVDTSAGFEEPKFTGDGEREEEPSVSDMLDNVDSDNFDFDQFDDTTVHDEEPEEFDINSMPDPFANAPQGAGADSGAGRQPLPPQEPVPQPELVPQQEAPAPMPAPVQDAPAAPSPSYAPTMMETASMAMDTVKRANELAHQNAEEQKLLDQQRVEQMERMEQQHADEMEEMRQKVAALEEENAIQKASLQENSAKSLMSTAEELLPTIERILNDDDTALENAEEIELFKKLLELCEYLPEEEKAEFMASPIRMEIEYLIAKMSGIPGLLKTALSLKKSGVLSEGEEDEKAYAVISDKNFNVTNHELRKVFKCMKTLSDGLDDPYLADAMCNRIDSVLEKIELAENSIQIF
ncbi:MAG: tetratricopeptide repeat protein [Treponema sp.]|nr:tetratricopeptide repeat protein [Treponema sp.]